MSIIHQALKKVEGIRHGYSVHSLPSRPPAGRKARPLPVAVLTIALIASSATVFYFAGSRLSFLKTTLFPPLSRPQDGPTPAEPKARGEKAPVSEPAAPGEAASKRPSPSLELNSKGLSLYNSGEFTRAAEEFKASIAAAEKETALQSAPLNNLGMAYLAMGEASLAEEAFMEALSLRPDYPEALNNYALVLSRKGERRKAEAALLKAAGLSPSYAEPHLNLAILVEMDGRLEEALSHYERFLSIDALKSEEERYRKADDVRKKVRMLKASLLLRPAR